VHERHSRRNQPRAKAQLRDLFNALPFVRDFSGDIKQTGRPAFSDASDSPRDSGMTPAPEIAHVFRASRFTPACTPSTPIEDLP